MWKPTSKQIEYLKREYIVWTQFPSDASNEERNAWIASKTVNKDESINKYKIPEGVLVATWQEAMNYGHYESADYEFDSWYPEFINQYNQDHPFKDDKEYTALNKGRRSIQEIIAEKEKNRAFKLVESLLGSLVLTCALAFAFSSCTKQADDAGKNGLIGGNVGNQSTQTQDADVDYSQIYGFNGVYAPTYIDAANGKPTDTFGEIPINLGDTIVFPDKETHVVDYKETDYTVYYAMVFFDRLTDDSAKQFINLAGVHFSDDSDLTGHYYQVLRYAYKVPDDSEEAAQVNPGFYSESNGTSMNFVCGSDFELRSHDTQDKWPVDAETKENMIAHAYNYYITPASEAGQIGEGFVIIQEDLRYTNWFIKVYTNAMVASGIYELDIAH